MYVLLRVCPHRSLPLSLINGVYLRVGAWVQMVNCDSVL